MMLNKKISALNVFLQIKAFAGQGKENLTNSNANLADKLSFL
jgi:hypothetical protein